MPSSPRPWRLPPPAAATTPSRVVAGRRLSPSRARWPAPASPEAAAQTGAPATGSTAIGPAPNASRRPRNFCRRRQQRELPDPLPPGTELDGTSRSSAASHGPPRAGPSASLPTQASPRPGTASRPSAQQPPGRLLPLSRPAQVAESSASVSDVRTRSTTSVRLLHGGILLPSGISGSFKTSRAGKFASLCDTCLESKVAQNMTRSRIGRPPKNLSPGTKTTTAASPTSSYGAKTTRAGSPTSYGRVPRNFYPVAKTPSAASPTSSGRVPKNFSPGSKPTSAGRITRKDNGLHKLVFMSGILPEGADVGYYVGGKRLLDGYIKELGIYCNCCNTVVSPSQFEGHASRAARRKPYHNIYMSNDVSLHELSVSLSKGRTMTYAASVQMAGSFFFVTPVRELFTENLLACLLYQKELGVVGIVKAGNRENVVWHTTTTQ